MSDLHYINCNICGNDHTALIAVQNNFRFVKCIHCGLVYMNPRPGLAALNDLYDTYHQRNGKDVNAWDHMMRGNFAAVSSLLAGAFPSGGRLLDIGCGYGHFLRVMEGRGWQAEGIDPSANTVKYARDRGLNVMQTTIDEGPFPEGPFQAVTMFYVLEHLTDPFKALKKVFDLLIPGGMLVIRVPHTTPIVRFLSLLNIRNNLYDAPFHLYDFSPSVIRRLLEKSGFDFIKVMPGEPTVPESHPERFVSVASGQAAKFLYRMSNGKLLLPGASKSVIAFRPGPGIPEE